MRRWNWLKTAVAAAACGIFSGEARAGEAQPAEAGQAPAAQVAWGQASNGVQAGLSAKVCLITCPADKAGFTGEILLNVVLVNTGKGAVAYEPPDENEALGWRAVFTPCIRGKPIAATIRPGVEVDRDDAFKLQARSTSQHVVPASFGTAEWIQSPGSPKKGDLPRYGLDLLGKGGFSRVPAVPPLPIGSYTVVVSYNDLKGCQFSTGALKIEIKAGEPATDAQRESRPDAEAKATIDQAAADSFIIPPDQQAILETGAWTPSAEQAKKAMDAIQRYLKGDQAAKPDSSGYAVRDAEKRIVERGGKHYRVQFVGEDTKGRKLIRCLCFPNREGDPNWKTKEYRYGRDGGISYWGIRYDPDKNECLDFWTHGEG